MIDQRRAHERVLYERYLASLRRRPRPVQVSLFPVETELNPGEIAILDEIADQLNMLGFGIKKGKGNTVTITGHPADSRNANPLAMLETIFYRIQAYPGRSFNRGPRTPGTLHGTRLGHTVRHAAYTYRDGRAV